MKKTLTNSYLSIFCTELSMLLQSGMMLSNGILMLQDDERDKDGKAVLQSILDTLDRSEPLSAALRSSGFFPSYMVHTVEVGEKTGRLVETLKALSEHYDRLDRLAESVKSAVLYPAILLVMMIAVVMVLIIQVLPIFNDVFGRLGVQMSSLATGLMRFGGWFGDTAIVIAAVLGVIFVIILTAWLVPGIRAGIKKVFMDRWGGSGILGRTAFSHFTSAMTLAMSSGLDTEEAIKLAASISGGSKAVDKRYEKCIELLRSGQTLADAMRDAGILSARNSRMLSLGSHSGMTDAAMQDIARRSDRAVQDEINRLVGRVEPALVIITSVIVGVILLSVMLPLMGIMTSIG